SSPSGRDIRRAKRGGVSTASLSLIAKKELLESFRSETIGKMETLSGAVKKLFRLDKLHGLLAWLFMKRLYTICLVGFRIYFRITNTGEEAQTGT
ncbi:MAG: hypothetical protein LUF30_07610, partial [Lachnospiraceae bacterium]|nr:hypothetical protein [Lachnospiraceae bacterium]